MSLVPSAFGQYQTNSPAASLDVNGVMTDGTFAAVAPTGTGTSADFTFSSDQIGQGYDIGFNSSPQVAPGLPVGSQTVNLDVVGGGFTLVSGGASLTVPGTGLGGTNYSVTVTLDCTAVGVTTFQGFAVAPASPDGVVLSQACTLDCFLDNQLLPSSLTPNPNGTGLTLGDDAFANQALGFTFNYYGVGYSDCFVGSNGFITFGTGDTDFTETVPEFLSGPPRIAPWWDDLNPSAGGTVTFFTDNTSMAEVAYTNVPEFAATTTNSFLCQFTDATQITFDYSNLSSVDALVGLSPGGSLSTGLPVNWSGGGGSALVPTEAQYERFDPSNAGDLNGKQVSILIDAAGAPLLWL